MLYCLLKLLKIWRHYIRRFGYPKDVRDLRRGRYQLTLKL
jgi:hypothetical protein